MASPHPSYPPLEMATAGCITISNNYENKDMGLRADNVISLKKVTPEGLARALDEAIDVVKFDGEISTVQVRSIDTETPKVDFCEIASKIFK
jgi:hypothetical protein